MLPVTPVPKKVPPVGSAVGNNVVKSISASDEETVRSSGQVTTGGVVAQRTTEVFPVPATIENPGVYALAATKSSMLSGEPPTNVTSLIKWKKASPNRLLPSKVLPVIVFPVPRVRNIEAKRAVVPVKLFPVITAPGASIETSVLPCPLASQPATVLAAPVVPLMVLLEKTTLTSLFPITTNCRGTFDSENCVEKPQPPGSDPTKVVPLKVLPSIVRFVLVAPNSSMKAASPAAVIVLLVIVMLVCAP